MKLDEIRTLFLREMTPEMLCGFSGGADSTAALVVAARLQQECGFTLTAVHFNHQLRKEADYEEEWCRNFASSLGVKFISMKLDVPHLENGMENAARQARLAAWKVLCSQHSGAAVITGHHADDMCENLFLRIFRGSNSSGLTGLRSTSTVENVKFIRPLLGVTKSEIEEFLRSNSIDNWMIDNSNFDSAMLRNYLRNQVIPGIVSRAPFAASGIRKTLEVLACDADFIENEAEKAFNTGNLCNRIFWCELHDAVAVRVLRKLLAHEFGADVPVSGAGFERFKRELQIFSNEPRIVPFGANMNVIIQADKVSCLHDVPHEVVWKWQEQKSISFGNIYFEWRFTDTPDTSGAETASFDADKLSETLLLSVPAAGEKFIPFGRRSAESIKKLRTDRKIAAYPALPVLRLSAGRAVWLPFIRNGNDCLVDASTKKIVTFYAVSKNFSK